MSVTKLLLSGVALASVLFVFGSQSAGAADLPMYTKARPVVAPVYDWTGFYLGGHVGWGWGHDDAGGFLRDAQGPFPAGTAQPAFPFDLNGVAGGGQVGFNYMVLPHIVFGIEADISAANINNSISKTSFFGTAVQDTKIDWLATARGRVGYAFNELLVYGTSGVAWGHGNVVNTQVTSPTQFSGPVGQSENWSTLRTGWTAGGGVEYGFARNWTTKLEYLYMDFGTTNHTWTNFNRVTVDHLTMNVVRLGLNYRF